MAITDAAAFGELDALPRTALGERILGCVLISGILGKGGMATVYKGVHSRLCVPVAVKVFAAASKGLSDAATEARLTAKINHPNIVRVYDVNFEGALLYIVEELIEGQSAYDLIRSAAAQERFVGEARALEICADVARGLRAIHREGIVHLDIKPQNILVCSDDGIAKIVDLGIAAYLQKNSDSSTGTICGTPGFMSRARISGGARCVQDDLYALGATLFELLTAVPAFPGKTNEEVFDLQRIGCPLSPIKLNPQVTECTARIVAKCLANDVRDRFLDATELLDSLLDARAALEPTKRQSAGALEPGTQRVESSAHVLCVDDDVSIREMVEEILIEDGHTVTSMQNGEVALEYMREHSVDVVLTDVDMPRMGGLALCQSLRKLPAYRDVPVVFVSGIVDMDIIRKAMGLGAIDYLVKPMNIDELKTRVRCLAKLQNVNRERAKLQTHLDSLLARRGMHSELNAEKYSKQRILLADDTLEIREMLEELLQGEGFETASAKNGIEALRFAQRDQFDLCILDISMPEMDGLEACRQLRNLPATARLPILFLTTLADHDTIQRAFAAGANDFLNKPAHPYLLRARIMNLLKLSARTHEAPRYSKTVKLLDE